MSDHFHPGPDTLSAFVEGVLPEYERAQCLAHLAECSRCREIVFAVQDTPAALVLGPVSVRSRRLRPMPLLAAAAAVCFALLGTWFYLRSRTEPPREQATARVTPPAPEPSAEASRPAEVRQPKSIVTKTSQVARRRPPERRQKTLAATRPSTPVPMPEVAQAAPPPPVRAEPPSSEVSVAGRASLAPPKALANASPPQIASSETSSGISGTVTDATGAAVPEATVELHQLAGLTSANTQTDQAGSFKFTGLVPGRYELRIQRPGFMLTSQQIEVRAREIAAVESRLQVGSTAETVEVTAAPSTLQTESSSMSRSRRKQAAPPQPRPLPSKLPAETTVAHGKIMLTVDSGGALFLSGNSGKSWKAVKPTWSGKITDLITPPDVPDPGPAQFQVTTDTGADWLSRDGRHWYPAAPEKK